MRAPNVVVPTPLRAAPAALLRAGCLALFVGLGACGGGGDDGAPPSNAGPEPAPPKTPGLVVGAASPVDGAASGNPASVQVALSANGDGYAVWRANDGTRHDLWANRYRAATAAWGTPVNIEASSADIDDFDVAVDASGNAVVAWHEVDAAVPRTTSGVVASARFDAGAGAWSMPVTLNSNSDQPRVGSNGTGAALAVYVVQSLEVRGRFLDAASGTWQPEAPIEQNNTGTGFSSAPALRVDGSGNVMAAWRNERIAAGIVASNYFSTTDGWGQIPPDEIVVYGSVPGSFSQGGIGDVQLAASPNGDFLVAWQSARSYDEPQNGEIFVSRFTPATRSWSQAQERVSGTGRNIRFQRIGTDAAGTAFLLWTEDGDTRRVLRSLRFDDAGATCSASQAIDGAVGGGAARADLGVDPAGDAIAIWQQFEGGAPDDGSRSNIAINRFNASVGLWESAVLAETQPGDAISPRVSVSGGQALLGWIQAEGGGNRVKAVLQPLGDTPSL